MSSDQSADEDRYHNKSSVLALRIVEVLANSAEPLALTALARRLGTNKWKISRHLHALRKEGFVVQDEATERFEPGLRLFAIGVSLSGRKALIAGSKPAMRALQSKVRLPVSLVGLVQDKAIVLDGVSENDPLAVVIGISLELHSSAHGKVALAFGPDYLLEQVLSQPLFVHNDKTITDPAKLREEIAEVRERGWAASLEERKKGLTSIAAPILSPNGTYMGSLGILYFGTAKPTNEHINELLRATQNLTSHMSDGAAASDRSANGRSVESGDDDGHATSANGRRPKARLEAPTTKSASARRVKP